MNEPTEVGELILCSESGVGTSLRTGWRTEMVCVRRRACMSIWTLYKYTIVYFKWVASWCAFKVTKIAGLNGTFPNWCLQTTTKFTLDWTELHGSREGLILGFPKGPIERFCKKEGTSRDLGWQSGSRHPKGRTKSLKHLKWAAKINWLLTMLLYYKNILSKVF